MPGSLAVRPAEHSSVFLPDILEAQPSDSSDGGGPSDRPDASWTWHEVRGRGVS
jgi:hypothetical protein